MRRTGKIRAAVGGGAQAGGQGLRAAVGGGRGRKERRKE